MQDQETVEAFRQVFQALKPDATKRDRIVYRLAGNTSFRPPEGMVRSAIAGLVAEARASVTAAQVITASLQEDWQKTRDWAMLALASI